MSNSKTILPNNFNTKRNDSGLLSVECAPFKADERAADHRAVIEDRRTTSALPHHRRRLTSKQYNTTPSRTPPDSCLSSTPSPSKTPLDCCLSSAPPPPLQPTPDSNPSSVSNQESQLQFFTSCQCSIETATILHASQSTSTTIERI